MQAAIALAAFDLVCQVHFAGDNAVPPRSTQTITYRVDPMLGRWCWGECVTTIPIAALSPSEVVFTTEGGDFAGPHQTVVRIQLLTGAYRHTQVRFSHPPEQPVMVGNCERTPFSGFPPGTLPSVEMLVRVPAYLDEVRPAATPR